MLFLRVTAHTERALFLASSGSGGLCTKLGGEVVPVEDDVGLYAVVAEHADAVDGIVDVFCCGIGKGEVPGACKGAFVEPDVGIDADYFSCVVFYVGVYLDGFQKGE